MINPTTDAISDVRHIHAMPRGITAGPDGNLWFTENAGKIGQINPTTDAITEYPIPYAGPRPGDHDGPRRQPLVHRYGTTRSASPP